MNPQGLEAEAPKHIQEAMKLDAEGYVTLFYIRMTPPGQPEVIHTLTPLKGLTWQGYEWESYPIHLTDYKQSVSGELSRPKLTLANPEGLFSTYLHARWMDGAEVVRYRVLAQHAEGNVNSFLKNTWRVRKVVSLNRTYATFELAEGTDGPFFVLPARAFYPPEFASVSV